jgi:hypothetical protein
LRAHEGILHDESYWNDIVRKKNAILVRVLLHKAEIQGADSGLVTWRRDVDGIAENWYRGCVAGCGSAAGTDPRLPGGGVFSLQPAHI